MINQGDKFNIWWVGGSKSNNITLLSKDFDWKLWWCKQPEGNPFCINPLSSSIASIEKLED